MSQSMLRKILPPRRTGYFLCLAFTVAFFVITLFGSISPISPVLAAGDLEIAAALPLSGDGAASYGQPTLEGVQLAIEEANASGAGSRIKLTTYDDQSQDDVAKAVAAKVIASPAALVVGPAFSTATLAAGTLYAAAGMAVLPPTATSDLITRNATTFRMIFKNSDQGETLANYLVRVLGQRRAAVFVVDSSSGRTMREGFEQAAEPLKIDAKYYVFKTPEEAEAIARRLAAEPSPPPIVFCTLDPEGAKILATLRRAGVTGPFLGTDAFGDESFSRLLSDLPEEKKQRGYFTDNLYGIAPVILDSANAETLSLAARFQKRFGHDLAWQAVSGFDAANLAIAALRQVSTNGNANATLREQRTAVVNYLLSLNDPTHSVPGLLGSFWFDKTRGRQQPIRIGKFYGGSFESAPLQIVPTTVPDPTEIASNAVFTIGDHYARLQRVIYTGVFLNEISRIDLTQSSFGADFYLWLRFTDAKGVGDTDPTDLIFPNLIKGNFDPTKPAEKRKMADGSEYWLWRVQGDFRNDFDLHLFPFDRQSLSLSFFNARAALDRIVYVLDKRSATGVPPGKTASIASPTAFRNLTLWDPLGSSARRENLVTDSPLGDLTRIGLKSPRELSGFLVNVELKRRTLATLFKSMLPLFLMTMIMYASTYFPSTLLAPRAIVLVTSVLSGIVLLTSINNQFIGIGYTVAVEYLFYIYFSLALLCIISLFFTERLRLAERTKTSATIEFWTRVTFLLIIASTLIGTTALYWRR